MPAATKTKKIGRNDVCSCGSGKKYKFCCLNKKAEVAFPRVDIFNNDQQRPSSQRILTCKQAFSAVFPAVKIIDISDTLTGFSYKPFQERNLEKNIIMLAEKQPNNQSVFERRGAFEEDIIVMIRGSYRVFKFEDLAKVFDSICDLIAHRLDGKNE